MHAAEFPLLSVGQFGLLAAQFPPGNRGGAARKPCWPSSSKPTLRQAQARAMAMPSRVRMRMRSASNSAKVARILKNSFPIGSPGS